MLIAALVMLPACDATTSVTYSTTASVAVTSCVIANDFYIIYETNWDPGLAEGRFLVLLDTKNNTIGTPVNTLGDYYFTDYCIPCDDLRMLRDAIIQYDIRSLSGHGVITGDGSIVVHPNTHYRITFFLDGEIYSVTFDTIATV